MTKRYLLFTITLILVDVFISLWLNADLLGRQEQLVLLREKLARLERENEQLKREVAQLSSLNRIAQLASEMGLIQSNQRLLIINRDQFASR